MGPLAIQVTQISKRYEIGARESAQRNLREAITETLTAPLRRLRRPSPADAEAATVWALKDVSFEVPPGEILGIIGLNGAGKSTLLKILSRITEPTTGRIEIWGRVASLLEVGTGFHPELTGRENIYLNGAILGMTHREMQRKFDEIVAFAEVEKFVDTPVKRYSSGMYLRLAFAVAAHLEPEILLVDEVLAVGDAPFQRKCLGKMGEVAHSGRTVLLVSHNMGAIQGLCRSAILLARGGVIASGDAGQVVATYMKAAAEDPVVSGHPAVAEATDLCIERVVLRNQDGTATTDFRLGESLTVDVHYRAGRRIPRPYFWLCVESQYGALFEANALLDGIRPGFIEGRGVISWHFPELRLLPQIYTLHLGVRGEDASSVLMRGARVGSFQVLGTARDLGLRGEVAESFIGSSSPLLVPYEWRLPDGEVAIPDWCRGEAARCLIPG
jgi:lipopolysaccharide transport system ATP-binding protein